jgi:hypothetical protein
VEPAINSNNNNQPTTAGPDYVRGGGAENFVGESDTAVSVGESAADRWRLCRSAYDDLQSAAADNNSYGEL